MLQLFTVILCSYGSRVLGSLAHMYFVTMYEINNEHSVMGHQDEIYSPEKSSERLSVVVHYKMTNIQIVRGLGYRHNSKEFSARGHTNIHDNFAGGQQRWSS